jgi:hypothetical protein
MLLALPLQIGGYKHHWQLNPPRQPLPPSLQPMLCVLTTSTMFKLLANLLSKVRREHSVFHTRG